MQQLSYRGLRQKAFHFSFLLAVLIVLSGCRSEAPEPAPEPAAPADQNRGDIATYQLKGIVVSSDAAKGEVSVDAEAIPGFMGAMTMAYKLTQPNIATELHPGDHITAVLHIASSSSTLDQVVVTEQARPDYKPDRTYNAPVAGQAVPNFKFVNQSGQTISIGGFQGKVLLVTFIYTRCPLPDYCIRMSRNFATLQQQLAADPALYDKTHLLSVSFDPAYDTPKVLRNYAQLYIGKSEATALSHWDFAVPPANELATVDEFFDVGVTPGPDRTLNHSLSTILIGADGKVAKWYPGNDWQPATVLADMRQAAGAAPTVSHQ